MEGRHPNNRKSYYWKNRELVLARMSRKYRENPHYREATRKRAKQRYHEDESYRRATIERAKARYRRLKRERMDAENSN